jgi:adenylate cyclase
MQFFQLLGRRRSHLLYHTIVIAAVGFLFTFIVFAVKPFTSINSWLSDQFFLSGQTSPNIVIIGIDDATLAEYGKWSEWRRSYHAQAIDNLTAAKARVIAFDVLFADTSSDDELLSQAIERNGNVILPVVGDGPLSSYGQEVIFRNVLLPALPLREACQSMGHANIVPDGDGVVRRVPLLIEDNNGNIYPALSLSVLHAFLAKPLPAEYILRNNRLYLLNRDIPVDGSSSMRVNYTSVENSYTGLSYKDVIEGNFDPSLVKHKIVLIGMTATGEIDTWSTPVSAGKLPGVWIHANAIDTILSQKFLQDAAWWINLLIMILFTLIAALALPRLRLPYGGILVAILFAGYLVGASYSFDAGYVIKALYPLLLLPLLYTTSALCMVIYERSDKRMIKNLFGRYVSTQVAEEILDLSDSGKLQLGGEQRTVSVLFADIRGFTQMSERMSPKEVVDMLNGYLSIIVDKVLEHEGMVNKFAGDCIMAVWNAPQLQDDHAVLAVRAAYESQQLILQKQKTDDSPRVVQFGIGINTGEAVAGNMGSMGRAEYTVIGDSVNLASRICSATPGGEIWIGQQTYQLVKDVFKAEEMKPQSFKGKSEPVVVYRII